MPETGGTVRVAAVQYAVGEDVAANLANALRMIDRAAADGAALIVLPEFANHCAWFRDTEHAFAQAGAVGRWMVHTSQAQASPAAHTSSSSQAPSSVDQPRCKAMVSPVGTTSAMAIRGNMSTPCSTRAATNFCAAV